MKRFIRHKGFFLILFLLLIGKEFFYSVLAPQEKYRLDDAYIKKLEKEIEDINLIKENNYKSLYTYGKVLYENPYQKGILHVLVDSTKDIQLNDYVVGHNGLIGLVTGLSKKEVRVKMLTNKDMALQIKTGGCYGLLKGGIIDNLNSNCQMEVNGEVVTSNLSYLDEEVPIGYIQKISPSESEGQRLEIKYYTDFNNLGYVIIMSKGD